MPVLLFFFPDLQGRKHPVREGTSAGGGVRGASSSSSTLRWSRHASVQLSRPQEKFKLIRRCCCFRPPRTRADSRVRKQPVQPRYGAVGLLQRASAPAPTAAPRRLLQHRVQQRWGNMVFMVGMGEQRRMAVGGGSRVAGVLDGARITMEWRSSSCIVTVPNLDLG